MKNFRKFLAVFLSIAMVMCSSLPSLASENHDATNETSETTKSKIEEQLKNDLGEDRANEILNGEPEEEEETSRGEACEPEEDVGASSTSPEEETELTEETESDVGASTASPEEETESADSVETSEEGSQSSPVQGESEPAEETVSTEETVGASTASPEEETESTDSVETSEEGSHSSPVQGESETVEETESADSVETSEEGSHSSPVQGESETIEETESAEPVSNETLLNLDPLNARPWMYFWVTDGETAGDTIHYSSADFEGIPNDAVAVVSSFTLGYKYSSAGLQRDIIKNAIFEDTIDALTCEDFFAYFINLDNIKNIENLNTANVTNMAQMFLRCKSLSSLNLNSFDTSNVENMDSMFADCEELETVELSNFDTSNVQYMRHIFYGCVKLQALDLSNFNTSKVSNMMFMFYECKELEELDLSSFNTYNVKNMESMFNSCLKLEKIIVSTKFVTTNVTYSDTMFYDCQSLVGGCGTTYDTSHVGKEYARIDKEYMPGYFTASTWMYYWTTSDEGIETIHYASPYYENIPSTAKGINTSYQITYDSSLVKTIIKEATFEDEIEAVTCCSLFYNFTKLEVINDINKLKTGDVTDMSRMFAQCWALREIDLGGLDTSNVRMMASMFVNCLSINKIEFNSDIKFVTSKVTHMNNMFFICNNLTYLDLRRFDTSKVTMMDSMFGRCSLLKTIVVSDSFDTSLDPQGEQMFDGCTSLEGGAGTKYNDSNPKDKRYARIDGGPSSATPGYFTDSSTGPWMYWYLTDIEDGDGKVIHYTRTDSDITVPIHGITGTAAIDYGSLLKSDVKLAVFDNVIEAETCYALFYQFENLKEIKNIENLKTNKVTNMDGMFYNCQELDSIDLKHMDTSNVASMNAMFCSCLSLTNLDLSNFKTGKVTDMNSMFDGCSGLRDLNISNMSTENVFRMTTMFYKCQLLTYLDLRSFNTSRVDDFQNMFGKCKSLETIVVSNNFVIGTFAESFNMFDGCSSLVGGNGTTYDSTKVNGEYARYDDAQKGYFSYAPWLYWYLDDNGKTIHYTKKPEDHIGMTRIDKVVYRNLMDDDKAKITKAVVDYDCYPPTFAYFFAGFRGLESIVNFNFLNEQYARDMQYMFYNCRKLSSFDLGICEAHSVKNMDYMFANCERLDVLNLSDFYTSGATSMNSMFEGSSSLKSLKLADSFNTSNVVSMNQMFKGCHSLIDLDLSSFNTANVTDMTDMFKLCSSLERVYVSNSFVTTEVPDNTEMFKGCTSLKGSSGTTYDDSHIGKEYACIDGGTAAPGYFYTNDWMWWTYDDNNKVLHLYGSEPTTAYGGVISGSNAVYYRGLSRTDVKEVVFESVVKARACSSMFGGFTELVEIKGLKKLDTSLVMNMTNMFAQCEKLKKIDLSGFDTSKVISMYGMFINCETVESLDLTKFDTSKVTNMYYMFANCYKLSELNLKKFDTSKVTNMKSMFANCRELTELDLTSFNTENVTSMASLFYGDSKLESLDLSSFDTSKVEYMGRMFANCGNLKTIVASVKFETYEVEDSSRMFEGCTSLKGGEGTAFDPNNLYLLYARIDGGTSEPGYFTGIPWLWWEVKNNGRELHLYGSKPGTGSAKGISSGSKVTYDGLKKTNITKVVIEEHIVAATCVELFSDFVNLEDIENFEQLETGFAHSMQQMFYNCKKLKSIDMNNFYTTDMTNMSEAFSGCESLTYIDLTKNFTTSRVEYMDRMFEGCKNLTLLDLSEFDTKHVKTMKLMFKDCSALKTIITSNNFVVNQILDDGQAMFIGCEALVGGKGTTYSSSHTDREYACIDEGPNSTKPGYFTLTGTVVVLDKISVHTNPTKISYYVGETLNPAGLTLDLTFSNGTSRVEEYNSTTAKEFTFSPSLSTRLTTAHTTVTVIYDGKATSFDIKVSRGGGGNPGGSSSGSSGGGGGGPTIAEDVPGITYLNATSAILGVFASSSSNWSYDPVDNSWQLNSTDANGNAVRAINGLYALTHVRTHIVNGVPIETTVTSVYCFNANAKMVTGWVKTLDGKWFFFENKKNADEGKMVTGWKQIQGAWYYFGEDGAMYINTVTPDGRRVGADGKLIQ